MSFCDSSARPWVWWNDIYSSLAGGHAQMRLAEPAQARKIPATIYSLDVAGLAHGDPCNPSLAVYKSRLFAIVRVISLRDSRSQSVLGEVVDRKIVSARALFDAAMKIAPRGHEDCRLFVLDNQLMISATVCTATRSIGHGMPQMTVAHVDASRIAPGYVQLSPRQEKNWMPVVDQVAGRDRLRFVYSVDPLVVVTMDLKTGSLNPPIDAIPTAVGHVRGSSPLIAYDDGWLSVVHQVQSGKIYSHRFAVFNRELTCVELSEPFYFEQLGIEFCAGLVLWQGKYLLSFGAGDKQARVAEVEPSVVRQLVSGAVPFGLLPASATLPPSAAGPVQRVQPVQPAQAMQPVQAAPSANPKRPVTAAPPPEASQWATENWNSCMGGWPPIKH
jgi:hypothetical protein